MCDCTRRRKRWSRDDSACSVPPPLVSLSLFQTVPYLLFGRVNDYYLSVERNYYPWQQINYCRHPLCSLRELLCLSHVHLYTQMIKSVKSRSCRVAAINSSKKATQISHRSCYYQVDRNWCQKSSRLCSIFATNSDRQIPPGFGRQSAVRFCEQALPADHKPNNGCQFISNFWITLLPVWLASRVFCLLGVYIFIYMIILFFSPLCFVVN